MSVGTGNTSPGLTIFTFLLLMWAILSYIGRIWKKTTKKDTWRTDDTLISLSLGIACVQVATVLYAVHRGFGNAWASLAANDKSTVYHALYASQIIFVLSTGLTRASCGHFTGRVLSIDNGGRRLTAYLVFACALCTGISFLVVALRPPLSRPWITLDGSETMFYRWLAVELLGCLIDIGTLGVATYFIWSLKMTVKKRLIVCSIFAIRVVIVTAIVACRLWALSPDTHSDKSKPSLAAGLLTEAEILSALFLASVTCLKPVLQPFHPGYFVSRTGVAGLTGVTDYNRNSKGIWKDAYYELSKGRSQRSRDAKQSKPAANISASRYTADDDASDQIDLIQGLTELSPTYQIEGPERRVSACAAGVSSFEPLHGGIAKTQTWSVRYD